MGIYPSLKNSALHCFFHSGFAPLALAFAGRRVDSHQKNNFGPSKRTAITGPRANLRSRFAREKDERRRDEESPGQSRGLEHGPPSAFAWAPGKVF